MRNVGRDVDEIARTCLGGELEPLAPAHPGLSANDMDDALEGAVVVRARLRVGMNHDRPGPQLLGAGASRVDRGGAVHAGRLRGVRVELASAYDAHSVQAPVCLSRWAVHRPSIRATRGAAK